MSLVENLSHPLISALGWTLFHALWQILLIALLWRSALFIARRASASIRYNISLIALLSIPVICGFTFFRQYEIYQAASPIVSLEFTDGVYAASSTNNNYFYLVQKNYPGFLSGLDNITPFLVWFYFAGLLVLSFYTMASYARINQLKTRQISPIPKQLQLKAQSFKARMGLKRRVKIFQSSKVSVPMMVGLFKPVILLPLAMLSSLSTAQVESILLHELYHLRRNDHFVNMLQNILEILFFFHPATWWISHRLREERENCVDEWVVEFTSTPLTYAQALMTLEENRSTTMQPVVAATQSKTLLLTRIKNIMTMKTRNFNPGQKLAAFLVILTAVFSVAWINPGMSINYGQPGIDYDPDTSMVPYYSNIGSMAPQEEAPDTPPVLNTGTEEAKTSTDNTQPRRIYTEDGQVISWNELSEKDREKIQVAMTEVRLAMQEVNQELVEKFNSGEFQQQMLKVQQELIANRDVWRQAMGEANLDTNVYFNHEEFKKEMELAREEIKKAMEEVGREMEYIDSEEFRQEMEKAREEIRKAMEDVGREMEYFNSEEFRQEMGKAREEMKKAIEEGNIEMEYFNSEEFRREMETVREEIKKALKEVNREMEYFNSEEFHQQINSEEFRQQMEKVREEIRKAMEEIEREQKEKEAEGENNG
ncbi:MAG: M56 family metallopeptidase [Bacteroides sp.]|jgi:beta-lactamase regulating signal transducer with metallopeptidase domain|nr:M56 family metallopeptidase [Bacteroides sp.]